jgi:hypothetical protein
MRRMEMRAVPSIASACTLACLACTLSQPTSDKSPPNAAPASEGPARPAPQVWLTPVDLTTGTGGGVVPITIETGPALVSRKGVRARPVTLSLFADELEPADPGCAIVRLSPPQ